MVYSADATATPALTRHAAGADLLVCEATFLEPGPELERFGHMTGEQAAAVAAEAGVKRLVLTHVMPFDDENAENSAAPGAVPGPGELAQPGAVYAL